MSLVILDRDGVINHDSSEYIKSPEEWLPIEHSLAAIARLNHAGFKVVVATNQSGLARKLFDIETLNRIHAKMHRQLSEVGGSIEAVFFCPHQDRDKCDCRKPKPGMLLAIASRLKTSLTDVPFIGDSRRDIEAARAVDARPILVRTGTGMATAEAMGDQDLEIYDDLGAAADALIAQRATN